MDHYDGYTPSKDEHRVPRPTYPFGVNNWWLAFAIGLGVLLGVLAAYHA